jgi:HlyD family secretion protein
VQKGVVSKDAFESIQSSYGQARAQIDVDKASIAQRQAELDAALLNLGYTDIVSPIDGVVLARKVMVGETIASNFQVPNLFVIASDLAQLQLIATVGEADIGALKPGDTATFVVKAFPTRTFKAKVAQIRASPDTQRIDVGYGVVLDVDNADMLLKPGMTATVRFTTTD